MTSSKRPGTTPSTSEPPKRGRYQWPSKLDVEAAREAMKRLKVRAKRVVPKR